MALDVTKAVDAIFGASYPVKQETPRIWENSMGTFKARIGVSDGNGGAPHWVEADVDTGSTYTVLPEKLLREQAGIQPSGFRTFTLADGRRAQLPIGEARLYVEDDVATSRVVFGSDNQYLLGATTLQVFGLIADTTNHRLIPAPRLTI